MENVRPYLVLGKSQRDLVTEQVRKALHVWVEEWLGRGTVLPTVSEIEPVSADGWVLAQIGRRPSVGIGWKRPWLTRAGLHFVGSAAEQEKDGNSFIGQAMAEAALTDLALRLCGVEALIRKEDPSVASQAVVRGAGFLVFGCQFEGIECFQIVGWPEWVASFRGKPTNRKPGKRLMLPADALGSEQVRIRALVGEAELPIADFASLAVGDVIVIDRLVGEAITVQVAGGDAFAGGHLCASGGSKAVELVAMTA
jgi:hypothetical protein